MRLWKITYVDHITQRPVIRWRSNQREATARSLRAKKEYKEVHGRKPEYEPSLEPVDIPKRPWEMVDLLNSLCENGDD
jgi:hypothetical protein